MAHIDCAVLAVPTANKAAYLEMTKKMAAIFKANGALSVVDVWSDTAPEGEVTSFRKAVQAKPDESIVVSWIIWPDKATAEAGMGAAMQDTSAMPESGPPFDGSRMIFAGFEMLHQA